MCSLFFGGIIQSLDTNTTDIPIVRSRTENLNDRCNHMVQQAIALTKKGLCYKQMLETRRSELQKAESEVFQIFNLVEYMCFQNQ